MRVFISWSGDRSHRVAMLLDDWLQCVLQACTPWLSSKDIDRGALWFSEINDQLANTSIGIICITAENKNKPWILFESGAIAKGLSTGRVCTFLVDVTSTDIENPLAQFNHTTPDRDGVWHLVRTINASLKESVLDKVFDTYWNQFDAKFKQILIEAPTNSNTKKRDKEDILTEVLSSIRTLDRRMRDMEINRHEEMHRRSLRKDSDIFHDKIEMESLEKFIINELRDQKSIAEIRESVNILYSAPADLVSTIIHRARKSVKIDETGA
jgi:hypothetical protein